MTPNIFTAAADLFGTIAQQRAELEQMVKTERFLRRELEKALMRIAELERNRAR